jgi:hypothetical protein
LILNRLNLYATSTRFHDIGCASKIRQTGTDIEIFLLNSNTITLQNIMIYAFLRILGENWDFLNNDIKNYLCQTFPALNISYGKPDDAAFVTDLVEGKSLPVFKKYLTMDAVSVAKLQITSHWFYVDGLKLQDILFYAHYVQMSCQVLD